MLFEVHAHTNRHSKCSILDPVTLVTNTVKKGLQGLIVTEHHYLWTDEEIDRLRLDAGVEKHFIILAGQEIETDIGHVLVYGAGRSITERVGLKELRKLYPDAALVWAHPFRKDSVPSKETLQSPLLDGIEIFSLNHTAKENYAGLKSWHELKFTALSGSDAHSESNAGVLPTQFDHDITTISDAATEIKKGRVRPFFKEIPKSGSDLTVTEITLGTKGDNEVRQRIIIKHISDGRKWEKAKEAAGLLQKIRACGFNSRLFRVPGIIDINEHERTIIEEGQRGNNLFDVLLAVKPAAGKTYYEAAARWIAVFHGLKLQTPQQQPASAREKKKFRSYANTFTNTGNSSLNKAIKLLEFIEKAEAEIFKDKTASFTLNHGDYHPKNIIIGHDITDDPGSLYVSVIDFANAISLVPAFDVGYFLAQFASQFHEHPALLKQYNENSFLSAYAGSNTLHPEFIRQVDLFKIRANMSIANYLIKVGKGETPELRRLIAKSTELMTSLT